MASEGFPNNGVALTEINALNITPEWKELTRLAVKVVSTPDNNFENKLMHASFEVHAEKSAEAHSRNNS